MLTEIECINCGYYSEQERGMCGIKELCIDCDIVACHVLEHMSKTEIAKGSAMSDEDWCLTYLRKKF